MLTPGQLRFAQTQAKSAGSYAKLGGLPAGTAGRTKPASISSLLGKTRTKGSPSVAGLLGKTRARTTKTTRAGG